MEKINYAAKISAISAVIALVIPMVSVASNVGVRKKIIASAESQKNIHLTDNVKQAMPVIMVLLNSFMDTGTPCEAQSYAEPGHVLNYGWGGCIRGETVGKYPVNAPENKPLDFHSIVNWSTVSVNEFSFIVKLCSPISETCLLYNGTMVNMGDGWKIRTAHPNFKSVWG